MSLPAGPARVRASNADRESVVAFIRGHWHEGRLTDAELDDRVGRALQARTLGDLRELYSDLPVPQPTGAERARQRASYLGRALKTLRGIVLAIGAIFVALVIIGLIVGPQDEEREAGGRGITVSPPAVDGDDDVPPPDPKITEAAVGETVRDGDVEFTVERIRPAKQVQRRADRGGDLIAAGDNRRFFVADVRVANTGDSRQDPFCGSLGAALHVAAGEEVDLIEDLYQLEGNQTMCSGGMAPDSTATVKLVFRVPEGDEAESLDVWNGDEPGDILGKTRIRVDA